MSSLNPSTSILGLRKAKHLLRRSCFQYSKTVLDQFAALTPEQALAQLTVDPTVFWEDPYDMKVNLQTGVSDDFWIHTPNTVPSDFPYGQFRKRGILSDGGGTMPINKITLSISLSFFYTRLLRCQRIMASGSPPIFMTI